MGSITACTNQLLDLLLRRLPYFDLANICRVKIGPDCRAHASTKKANANEDESGVCERCRSAIHCSLRMIIPGCNLTSSVNLSTTIDPQLTTDVRGRNGDA